jgi:hypothetical protein
MKKKSVIVGIIVLLIITIGSLFISPPFGGIIGMISFTLLGLLTAWIIYTRIMLVKSRIKKKV